MTTKAFKLGEGNSLRGTFSAANPANTSMAMQAKSGPVGEITNTGNEPVHLNIQNADGTTNRTILNPGDSPLELKGNQAVSIDGNSPQTNAQIDFQDGSKFSLPKGAILDASRMNFDQQAGKGFENRVKSGEANFNSQDVAQITKNQMRIFTPANILNGRG